jgi:hypothetical protein
MCSHSVLTRPREAKDAAVRLSGWVRLERADIVTVPKRVLGRTMITGRCLCGAVHYATDANPITTRLCWCRLCQYIATGNAAVSICFPSVGLSVYGETRDFKSIADSGITMHRRFCPVCGVHLFSEAEARPHLVFIRAGTLDDLSHVRPAATIWTTQAPAWACVSETIPSWEKQPPPVG